MAKNDRFVVKHEEGWVVKKTKAGRSSSVHSIHKKLKSGPRGLSITWEEAKSVSKAEGALSEIPTRCRVAMIPTHRVTAATDI